jgi:hypothetical protein
MKARRHFSSYGPVNTKTEYFVTRTELINRAILQLIGENSDEGGHYFTVWAPRQKTDLRIYEANYHFIIYGWLSRFLQTEISVFPEFPTGNAKIDILIQCQGKLYGLELKSFTDAYALKKGIQQAVAYAVQLKLSEIFLAVFIDSIDKENRIAIEIEHLDATTDIKVYPQFITVNE